MSLHAALAHSREFLKTTGDWIAGFVAVGTLAAWLPQITAVLSIVWLCIRIWDRLRYGPQARSGRD